jgi:hypothetical protein
VKPSFVAQWKEYFVLLSVFPANQHLICDRQKTGTGDKRWGFLSTQSDIDWLEGGVLRQTFTAVS